MIKKNGFLHAVLIRSSTFATSPELSFSVPQTTRLHPLETVTFVSIFAPADVGDTTWPPREPQVAHRKTDEENQKTVTLEKMTRAGQFRREIC